MGIEWTFMALCYALVSARIYVRIWMRGNKLYSADYWLIAGLMSAQGLLICDTLTYKMNAMDNFTISNESLDKIRFATNYFFDTGIYFPKFSIIAFYYNLVPPTNPRMRKALYVLTGITATCALITFFGDTFWCGPDPSVNWIREDASCTVFAAMDLMRLNWSLNFLTEVLNVVYPFPLIRDIILRSRREKIGLGVIFGLGTITIGVSIGRFVTQIYVSNGISIYIWATAEICISVMVVALTALRPLLRKISSMISTTLSSNDPTSGYRISSINRSHKQTIGGGGHDAYWRNENGTHRSHVLAAMPGESPTGSEVELNDVTGILKTQQVSVSSETISDRDIRQADDKV
ncbi:hypothetical protein ACJ41O_012204 [Fusarium nematophilum]